MSEKIIKENVSRDSEELSESSYESADTSKPAEDDPIPNDSDDGQKQYEYDEPLDEIEGEASGSDCTAHGGEEEEEEEEAGDSDSVIIEYEREEGDGQESIPAKEKKLDDDEDRRNPQYIPKRGTFYEHDDRTAVEDVDEAVQETEVERGKESQSNDKKKVWKENENRWCHDRYNEDEQTPKSRDELVAVYGYDIRNEEAPPRARRRRRYGRGPNKYTRNWEDEDAYSKTAGTPTRGARRGRGGRQGGMSHAEMEEEFPPLVVSNKQKSKEVDATDKSSNASELSSQDSDNRTKDLSRDEETKSTMKEGDISKHSNNSLRKDNHILGKEKKDVEPAPKVTTSSVKINVTNNGNPSANRNHVINEDKFIEDNIQWKGRGRGRGGYDDVGPDGNRRMRGRGGSRGGVIPGRGASRGNVTQSVLNQESGRSVSETRLSSHDEGSGSDSGKNYQIASQVITRTPDDISKDMNQMSLNDQYRTNKDRRPNKNAANYHQNTERRQPVVPPRMQDNAANRPKRYSSQRQRSLPETGAPAYSQPHAYYPQGYVQQPVYADAPPQPPPPPQQAPPAAPLLAHPQPPSYAAPYPSPPTFIQPVPAPPPRILPPPGSSPYMQPPPGGAPMINYIPAPTQGQYPPQPYPQFQGFTAVAPGQPHELFQPQGITYYSPEEQVMTRPVTQKRQRSAIPIVPPPDTGPRGRGRLRESDTVDLHAGGDPGVAVLHNQPSQQPQGKFDNALESNVNSSDNINVNIPMEQEVHS